MPTFISALQERDTSRIAHLEEDREPIHEIPVRTRTGETHNDDHNIRHSYQVNP